MASFKEDWKKIKDRDKLKDWNLPHVNRPEQFSLVDLMLDDGMKILGWWNGDEWYSRRLNDRKVVRWRNRMGQY